MPYIDIANFKYGLDARRSELTSLPGSLLTLNNCHINQGGQIEKRLAFVRTALPANTFGLEATDVGIITFGSNADPGGWPIGNVTAYQRLQHPAVTVFSASYDATKHAMTKVVFSTAFEGNAFVAATFADGFTFLYYNGVVIQQSYTGVILTGYANQTAINTASGKDIGLGFNSISGWVGGGAGAGSSFMTGANPGYGTAYSPSSVTFDVTETQSSTGVFASYNFQSVTPFVGTPGTASFTVNAVAGTYTLTAPVSPTSSASYIIANAVAWAVSNNNTASAIATAVNARTAATGFSAVAVGAVVTVTNPLLTGQLGVALVNYTWNPLSVTAASDAGANGNHAFSLSTRSLTGSGQNEYFMFAGSWAVGDYWSAEVVSTTGDFTLGVGNLGNGWWSGGTVIVPSSCIGFVNRVYIGNGNQFNFSSLGDPTGYNEQNVGAGDVPYTSQYGNVDTVNGFANYQGRLAVFGRYSVQIWITDANPDNFALQQTLPNTGTFAPLSVQSLGELDVFYLNDTGIRSLRVRDSSLNAYVNDLGSPVDQLIQPTLLTLSATQLASCCGIIEPTQNRYWIYVPNSNGTSGTIYVLSYFPSNKIVAWSTYDPTYSAAGVQTQFIPQKFLVYKGVVYARDSGAIYAFGGTNGATYDNVVAVAQIPYLAGGGRNERPGHWKQAKGIDFVISGAWKCEAGMDWVSGTLETVVANTSNPTFDGGFVAYESKGTHWTMKFTSTGSTAATISSMMFHYELCEETA